MRKSSLIMPLFGFLSAAVPLTGCQSALEYQNRPSSRGSFKSPEDVRLPPPGTREFILTAKDAAPPPLTRAVLDRGHARYEIHCAVCHGFSGNGDGVATTRGFAATPAFSIRNSEAHAIYVIIREGRGAMQGFAGRVPPDEAWAIAEYVRALGRRKR